MRAFNFFTGLCMTFLVLGAFTLPFFNVAYAYHTLDSQEQPANITTSRGAGGFVPLEDFSRSPRFSDAYRTGELKDYLNKIFVGAIAIGALLAVLRLAWAGFEYLASDLWSTKDHAKEIIRETLLGLFLLLAIWVILHQINPDILKLNVNLSSSTSGSGTGSRSASSAFDDRATPNRSVADDTPCTTPDGSPGLMLDGTCRYAPTRHGAGSTAPPYFGPGNPRRGVQFSEIPPGAHCFMNTPNNSYDCYADQRECRSWAGQYLHQGSHADNSNCQTSRHVPLDSSGARTYNDQGSIPPDAWCNQNSYTGQYNCSSDRNKCENLYGPSVCKEYYIPDGPLPSQQSNPI